MGAIVGSVNSKCLVTFGTNTQPVTFTVVSNLSLGFADFNSIGPGGVTNSAFPPGSRLRVGSPTDRGAVTLGNIRDAAGAVSLFGQGISDVTLYAATMVMGRNTGNNGYYHYTTNDFRGATQCLWNVSESISMGIGASGDNVYTYLPANGTVGCSNLIMGHTGNVSSISRTLLILSNTVFSVSNAVTIMETAAVTNFVVGQSSGLDIGTTNLDIQDPQAVGVYADYGRIVIRFVSDPVDPTQMYWGLRIKGNAVSLIQSLTNTVPQRLSWTTTGLSPAFLARFGIYYDDVHDITYVGIPKTYSVPGVMILVQ
jgi:hypothetical protein